MKALLVLEDGTVFEGRSFGVSGERVGEVVFNTSITGYQEILTDPSYKGQIVTMTYPLIGNYGINSEDPESRGPQVEGFIVREYSELPSNWRSEKSLGEYLREHNVVAIEGVDTRALTRHIRLEGAMKGILSTLDLDPHSLLAKCRAAPGLVGRDLVRLVTPSHPYLWRATTPPLERKKPVTEGPRDQLAFNFDKGLPEAEEEEHRFHVVTIDCGVKFNSLRRLRERGCRVTVVPAHTSAEEILSLQPDGIYLSNGPGDPAAVTYVFETVRELLGHCPIFGICLGHQMIGLACGGRTFKLKFGHRGGNQPVKNLKTGRVEITSQNHGFAVDADSLEGTGLRVTHINLNDYTVEGMEHETLPVFCVQYHPEAAPGPHDADYLFTRFMELMAQWRSRG